MSESGKRKRDQHPPEKPTQGSLADESDKPAYTSPEITLDQVIRSAFELHRLYPNTSTIVGDVLASRGQQEMARFMREP
jgi:hypothetical protein